MYRFVTAVSVLLLALPALAQFDSGSDGSDGDLNCTTLGLGNDCASTCTAETPCEVLISLGLAASLCDCDGGGQLDDPCEANCPSPVPGQGIYDADEWAVVYKYITIDIPAFVTVTFANHRKGAPVMWLASGDVTIAGTVVLDGADGSQDPVSSYAIPGPGGFSGGIRRLGASAGFGPGGGSIESTNQGGGGGYGTVGGAPDGVGGMIYGTASIVPLIGGSGGAFSSVDASSGGAGGGAILIASSGDIFLDPPPNSTGGVFANGGNASSGTWPGSGSGGGIRLVANEVSGMGILRTLGGTAGHNGGEGRIRVEANSDLLVDRGDPPFTTSLPGSVFPEVDAPSLRVTAINGKPVPVDPLATVVSEDVAFTAEGSVIIDIEAQNVPVGLFVNVRIVQARGGASSVILSDTPLDGTLELSTTTAQFTFPTGGWEVQLSVQLP